MPYKQRALTGASTLDIFVEFGSHVVTVVVSHHVSRLSGLGLGLQLQEPFQKTDKVGN